MSSPLPPRKRANIELVILGFLVSLTLKGALDAAYGTLNTTTTIKTSLAIVWNVRTIQVGVLLVTLMRFVYGAFRIIEDIEESAVELDRAVFWWDVPFMLLLFVFFYLTGLLVQHPESFYAGLIAVHFVDAVWFVRPALFARRLLGRTRRVMRRFLLIDLVTVLVLLLVLRCPNVPLAGAVVMILLAALDLVWNGKFFFHPELWRTETG